MLINVPQYIDVEDKIVGPLSAKQLGWIIALGVIALILWNMVPAAVFFIVGIPIAIFFLAMAFYKPYGQPAGSFLLFGIMYFFRPKVYMWKRTPERYANAAIKVETAKVAVPDKHISAQTLSQLAQLLDSEGNNSNSELEKMLKPSSIRKY